jgi:hypothetical protein
VPIADVRKFKEWNMKQKIKASFITSLYRTGWESNHEHEVTEEMQAEMDQAFEVFKLSLISVLKKHYHPGAETKDENDVSVPQM